MDHVDDKLKAAVGGIGSPPSVEELKNIATFRSSSLSALVALYELAEMQKSCTDSDAFAWLVGAAFSLWRAAPLVYGDGTGDDHSAKRLLLNLLIRDNAVGYPQERTTSAWTVGYYLNNALFRLNEVTKLLLGELESRERQEKTREILTSDFVHSKPVEIWRLAIGLLDEYILLVQTRLRKTSESS